MTRLGITGLLMLALCSTSSTAFAQAVAKGKNELSTDLFFISSQPGGVADAERTTSAEWEVSYARFLSDHFSAGPLFRISKSTGNDALGYAGGQGRYYFGDLTRRFIPVVEVSATHSVNDPVAASSDVQVLAGVLIPMGSHGGRLRISPYYYRGFFDEAATGYSSFQSFGISWSVALLF